MKKILMGLLMLVSVSSYATETGNVCTIALFKKTLDVYGNPIPDQALGLGVAVNSLGTAGVFSKLYNVNKKRAVIFRGVINMGGAFRAQFEEVDQDKYGEITFGNPKLLVEEKFYYSPYPELPAKNEPQLVEMENYMATISCILYAKR